MNGKVFLPKFVLIAAALFASGCSNVEILTPSPIPGSVVTALPSPTVAPSNESWLVVTFVKDGNIQLWDERMGQIQTILSTGDVIAVTMSDDGQVIAFLRRSVVQLTEGEWFEQSALWAVDRNGGNPRELVSAESLRQRLKAAERESTNDEIEGRRPPPSLPMIPGHQVVGRVVSLGSKVKSVKTGDRVGVAWIFSACGNCKFCLAGNENLMPRFYRHRS